MNIIICDDEKNIVNLIHSQISEFFAEKSIAVKVYTFISAEEVMTINQSYTMAFLDIEMEDLNGIDLAKWLKEQNENVLIFFITSHADYLDDAFDVHAFRYLHKPINHKRLCDGLEHALKEYEEMNFTLDCECDDGDFIININDIIYLYIEERKVKLVTQNRTYTTKNKIKDWKTRLETHNFSQPHNSFLVNLKYICSFAENTITLKKGTIEEVIYISRRRKSDFKKDFLEMVKRNYD